MRGPEHIAAPSGVDAGSTGAADGAGLRLDEWHRQRARAAADVVLARAVAAKRPRRGADTASTRSTKGKRGSITVAAMRPATRAAYAVAFAYAGSRVLRRGAYPTVEPGGAVGAGVGQVTAPSRGKCAHVAPGPYADFGQHDDIAKRWDRLQGHSRLQNRNRLNSFEYPIIRKGEGRNSPTSLG